MTNTDTLFGRALADDDSPGGRFSRITPRAVVGATPTVPMLPASSPWHADPVGDEPPLGIRVDDVPDLGFPDAAAKGAGDDA